MPTDRQINTFATLTPPGQKPVVTSIMRDMSAEALAELRLWLEQNPPAIGISNILGFSQFTAQAATASGTVSTTSAAYTALGGPNITMLPDGKYVIVWGGCAAGNPGVSNAKMAIGVNAASAPATTNAITALTSVAQFTSIMAADVVTLSGGNNTVGIQYASSDGVSTAQFQQRFIVALRYANK